MQKKRKISLIILPIAIAIGIFLGKRLYDLDKKLSSLEMIATVAGLIVFVSIFELFAIYWENRYSDRKKQNIFDLIGKKGTINKKCSPVGTIRIGNEVWKAISINGEVICTGEDAVVKKREGLKLFIEKTS